MKIRSGGPCSRILPSSASSLMTLRTSATSGRNELFFSAASGWEIAIKARLGRLEIPDEPGRFLTEQLSRNAIQVLPIYLSHAVLACALPGHHRDPFDRLLISRAILERLTVLSADPQISRYAVEVVW